MIRMIILSVVLSVIYYTSFGELNTQAKTVRLSEIVKSGKSTIVAAWGSWDANCKGQTVNIDVLQNPKHGKVSPRVGRRTIQSAQAGTLGKCRGKIIKGLILYYKSNAGYRGRDKMKARVTWPHVKNSRPTDYIITITVR